MIAPQTDAPPTNNTDSAPDLGDKRRKFRAFETNKRSELEEARDARRYYHDKQWTDAELAKLGRRNQPPIVDNVIKPKINFLVGVEQKLRRDPKAFPRTPIHEKEADVATACIRYVCERSRWESVASAATHDGLVSNVGVVAVMIEPSRDGFEPVIKHVGCDRFWYDTRSEKVDFLDAAHLGLVIWMDVDEAIDAWPQHAAALRSVVDRETASTIGAERDRDGQWYDYEHKRVRILEMWEKRGGQWHYCKFTGDLYLEGGLSPYVDEDGKSDHPYVAWCSYIDEKGDRYGPIRSWKYMQDEINHRRSKFLHILNTKQTFSQEGSLNDVDEFKRQVVKPDGHIVGQGEWMKDFGVIDQAQDLKGQAELLMQAQQRFENNGPNQALVGRGGGVEEQSGKAILARRESGMIELSPVFERNRDWKLRVYRKVWACIRQAWTAEKIIRVTDDEDSVQFIQVNQMQMDPMTGAPVAKNVVAQIDVDIILDEGPDTITQTEDMFQAFASIGEAAAGPLGKVLIELSNTPNKERLLKMIDEATGAPPEVQELQQRMAAMEAALAEANVAKAHAEVENKRADTVLKLTQALIPPDAMSSAFPIPFADMGGGGPMIDGQATPMMQGEGEMPPMPPMGQPDPFATQLPMQ